MENAQTRPMSVLFYRMFWIILGPFGLFGMAAGIVQGGGGWLTARNLVFWMVLLATVLCRWGDFWKGEGTNSYGEPVTEAYMRRYTIIAMLVGGVVWAGANVAGSYLV